MSVLMVELGCGWRWEVERQEYLDNESESYDANV